MKQQTSENTAKMLFRRAVAQTWKRDCTKNANEQRD